MCGTDGESDWLTRSEVDKHTHASIPLGLIAPPLSCVSSALIMTLGIKESVKQGGIDNEKELIRTSHSN